MAIVVWLNTIIKEDLLAREVTRLLNKELVVAQRANTTYEGMVKQQGDTVSIQTFPNIAWTTGTTAGADISLSTFVITKDQLVVDQLAVFGTSITNLEEVQSNLSLRNEVAKTMMYWQKDTLDKFIIATAFAAWYKIGTYADTALSASTIYGALEAMRVRLSGQNAFDQAALFVSPAIASLIRQSSLFDGFREGLDVRKNAFVGRMSGFEIYETNNLWKYMLAMDKNSVHFAAQWTGFKTTEAPKGFTNYILWEMAYWAKVCTENQKRIVVHYYNPSI